jgi:hypothetical protein
MVGTIKVNVVVSENTNDTLTITRQPVQQGASITDHAYKEPTTFSHTILFAANLGTSLAQIYTQLLTLQASRVPFNIVTPKRTYNNMLMGTLAMTTDQKTENILSITCAYQEIILVSVGTVQVPRQKLRNAGNNGATQNAGKKSALASFAQALGGLSK